jgi:hypothetical protein
MHIDQEDIDAMKSQHAEDRQDFIEAKAKVDHEIPDFVTKPFRHRFVGNNPIEMVAFVDDMSSDELFAFAKLVSQMAEAKQAVERTEAEAKRQGITL